MEKNEDAPYSAAENKAEADATRRPKTSLNGSLNFEGVFY